jgi:hypothetical protein
MGIGQDLRVAARRWRDVRRSRGGAASPTAAAGEEREDLRHWFSRFQGGLPSPQIRDLRLFEIEASDLPWVDTGMDLEEGQWVSTLASGRVVLSDALDVWIPPQFQLWMRVGENSEIFNGSPRRVDLHASGQARLPRARRDPSTSPRATSRSTRSSAEMPPKRTLTPSRCRTVEAGAGAPSLVGSTCTPAVKLASLVRVGTSAAGS